MGEKEARQFSMFMHLSQFLNFIIPLSGLIIPLVMWAMKKDQSEFINQNGKSIVNFQISLFIYFIVAFILVFVVIGILALLALFVYSVIVMIIAAVKANEGTVYKYPLTIQFLKLDT